MPNQFLPIEMPLSSNRKTDQEEVTSGAAATTRSPMITISGPICHLRSHPNPQFGLARLGIPSRDGQCEGLTLESPLSPLNRVLNGEANSSSTAPIADGQVKAGKNPPKPSRSPSTFLRDRIKRLEFLNYFLFTLLLVETAGLLTDLLLKVLTQN